MGEDSGMMVVDFTGNDRVERLVRAMHSLWTAIVDTRAAVPSLRFSSMDETLDELGWWLADAVGHKDTAGNEVTYRAGGRGVTLSVWPVDDRLRGVNRKVELKFVTY